MSPGGNRDRARGALLPSAVLLASLLPPDVHPAALAPLALLALLLAVDLARPGAMARLPPAAAAPLLCGCALAAISSLLSVQPVRSARLLTGWLVAGVVFASARRVARGPLARALLMALALSAVVQAGTGIYQAAVSFPQAAEEMAEAPRGVEGPEAARWSAVRARLESGRAVGLLGLPALLASVILPILPVALAGALLGSGRSRILWGAAAALLAAGLFATRSLGGAAALLAATAICSTWWLGVSRPRRRVLLGLLALVAALVALPRLGGGGDESAARALDLRAGNWAAALSMAATHPAAGAGPGSFGVLFPLHRVPGGNETQHAHNSILEAVAEMGLPFLVPLGLLLVGFLRMIGRASAGGDPDGGSLWLPRALAVGCLAWALQNLVDYSAYVQGSLVPFMAAAGLTAGLAAPSRGEAGAGRAPAGAPARLLLAAAGLAAAAFAVPDSVSRWHLDRAVSAAREGDRVSAASSAASAVRWNPFDAEAWNARAISLIDLGSALPAEDGMREALAYEALDAAGMAVRRDPLTANRRRTLARARAGVGDMAGAWSAISMAVRLNPLRTDYAAERDLILKTLTGGGEGR